MKSKDSKKASDNFAFDDDTSDSDDELQMEAFKGKLDSIKPSVIKKTDNTEIEDNEDFEGDEADDESDNSDGDQDDDTEEDDTEDSESESDEDKAEKPKLSEDKLVKLSKLQQQLASMSKDEEDSEESEEESSEEEYNEQKEEGYNHPDAESNQEENLELSPTASKVKRPLEEGENAAKKQKTEEMSKEDKDRLKFRENLSKMSIDDIQQLKGRLGLKLFHQKMSGIAPVRGKKVEFKRENKNRPREMSSKKTVGRFREVVQVAKVQKRDPRFDPLCGEFDEKLFKDNYKFVNEIKSQDLAFLKKQIREEEDPERRKSIKYLIQRTENQLRQEAQNKVKEQEKALEQSEKKDQLASGVKPFYVSKSKQKEIKLVDQYEKLKQTGGLDNYIKKKTKKNLVKDRKKFENL